MAFQLIETGGLHARCTCFQHHKLPTHSQCVPPPYIPFLLPGFKPVALVGLLRGLNDTSPFLTAPGGGGEGAANGGTAGGGAPRGGRSIEAQRRGANRERVRDAFFSLARDASNLAASLGQAQGGCESLIQVRGTCGGEYAATTHKDPATSRLRQITAKHSLPAFCCGRTASTTPHHPTEFCRSTPTGFLASLL